MEKTGIATVTVVAIAFALSCLLLLLSSSMLAPALAEEEHLPDLNITAIKPYHYEWCEECDPPCPKGDPWFKLENYVEVTVGNNGTDYAESFEVTLYADDKPIRSKTEEGLSAGEVTNVKFEWTPEPEGEGDPLSCTDTAEGAICTYTDTSKTYTLKVVVDEEEEVLESNETNNINLTEQEVIWNGYMYDEPLENYVHGEVEGGIIYTTGDGQYRGRFTDGTEYNTYYDVNYDLKIPGNVKLARLYIYHTWSKPDHTAPKIGVTLKTPSDSVHDLSMEKSYNDIKGDFGAWWYVWGTYAYNITEYVGESGESESYVVTVTNLNSGSDDDFATEYAFAAPAILVVYEDTTAPKREYWINEGADILMGGRRGDGGFLDLEDCRNSATFDEEHLDLEVEKATLAVVSPWGEDDKNVLYFNDEKLGEGVYCGYHDSCSSDEEIEGISMSIGASSAQVGIAAFDVTDDLEDYNNEVIQGDDGDNMMPANAFLVITYEEEEGEEEEEEGGEEGGEEGTSGSPNITTWNPVEAVVNSTEDESRTFNISVNQTVDVSWQINGTEVQTNESITEAAYTNTSAVIGTWNVSAIATNTATELSDIHTWIWKVTQAALTATPTPEVNITQTPTATSTSTVNVTPTPTITQTPTPTEEKQKPGADEETPVPGFGLALSLFMLIVVAYLIRKRGI